MEFMGAAGTACLCEAARGVEEAREGEGSRAAPRAGGGEAGTTAVAVVTCRRSCTDLNGNG